MTRSRSPFALSAVVGLLVVAGCATTPVDPAAPAPVVSRTAANTTWSSPNAGTAAPTPAAAAPTTPQSRVATVDTARGVVASAGAGAGAGTGAPVAAAGTAAPAAAAIAAPALRAPAERLVFFDYDSFAIRDEFKAMLEGHARVLAARRDQRLTIEGHTDERGGREYNLALGQKRAEAVLRSLALLGASESQLEAVSFGKERLVNTAGTEAAMAQNRRAELKDR